MTSTTLTKRVEKLEEEIEELKKRVEEAPQSAPSDKKTQWMKTLGMSKDDPTFDEAIELGRRWRRRQPKC